VVANEPQSNNEASTSNEMGLIAKLCPTKKTGACLGKMTGQITKSKVRLEEKKVATLNDNYNKAGNRFQIVHDSEMCLQIR
jgi:hypothetical protein